MFSQASVILFGGGACVVRRHDWQRGACLVKWGMHGEGDMCGKGRACVAGEGVRGRKDSHCSGRYAFYWNAFLYNEFFSMIVCSIEVKTIIFQYHIFHYYFSLW